MQSLNIRISDLGDVEAHDEVEREDVFIAANVNTPGLKIIYQNKIRLKLEKTESFILIQVTQKSNKQIVDVHTPFLNYV